MRATAEISVANVAELDAGSPEQIYSYVTDGVRDVIGALEAHAADAEDESVQTEVIAALNRMQERVSAQQEELRASADWKDFTVAFYGETNAGKSTIIESLRIHLGEAQKLEQHRKFDALVAAHGLDEGSLEATRNALHLAREEVGRATRRVLEQDGEGPGQLRALELEKSLQLDTMAIAYARRKWWQRLCAIFRSDPQAIAVAVIEARIVSLRAEQANTRQRFANEVTAAESAMVVAEVELARRHRSMSLLLEHSDGTIIGDGRPDFTKSTQRYVFDNNGAPIVLLDVPGIEGGEASVMAHIDRAVQTAHAVFYVTGKAARPQHGDKEDGTLEKIKRHLGPQTEVWALFNKRVTSTMPLRSGAGLFVKDAEGIDDLDKGLGDALPGNYKGVLPVSAYPAFLALADRLPPPEAQANTAQDRTGARTRFLTEFDIASLLQKTGFATLAAHLASMAVDAPRKIRRANMFKASQSLRTVVKELGHYSTKLEVHASKVAAETKASQRQVSMAATRLRSSLRSDASASLRTFETSVRSEIYKLIDTGINKNELTEGLQLSLNEHAKSLQVHVGERSRRSMTAFLDSIAKTTERFQKHMKDLGDLANGPTRAGAEPTFVLDLKIDSGVNVVGLVTSVLFAIGGLISGPAGWIAITLSALGVVISIAKAVWSLVSEKYKKAQQREAVSENLTKAVATIKADLESSERAVMQVVDGVCTEARKRLAVPHRGIKAKAVVLRLSTTRLDALSTRIETTLA